MSEQKPIEMGNEYRQRNGRGARVYSIGNGGDSPVHCALEDSEGNWYAAGRTADGRYSIYGNSNVDLVEVEPRIKLTLVVDITEICGVPYPVLTERTGIPVYKCIARVEVPIDVEVGHGLPEGGAA